jgi:hypothetical protein
VISVVQLFQSVRQPSHQPVKLIFQAYVPTRPELEQR